MQSSSLLTYISTVLHIVAQVLLVPVMIALALLIMFTLFQIGALIVERFTEHRHYKVNSPKIINDIHESPYEKLKAVVEEGNLLRPQREALINVIENMSLEDDELFALAKMQVEKVNDRYKKTLLLTEQVSKIAPMCGLMATLIPLGPGIVAMGQGNVTELSMALLIAFDGTVAGLVAAVIAMIVTAIRKRWYANYMVVLEALMTAILSKADLLRQGK